MWQHCLCWRMLLLQYIVWFRHGWTLGLQEAWWPHGWCAQLRIEQSRFESWPGTLCCVLGQTTVLLQCLSPPRCINGYQINWGGGGGRVTLQWTSIPFRQQFKILLVASCYRNSDKLRLMGHLAHMQTLPYYYYYYYYYYYCYYYCYCYYYYYYYYYYY